MTDEQNEMSDNEGTKPARSRLEACIEKLRQLDPDEARALFEKIVSREPADEHDAEILRQLRERHGQTIPLSAPEQALADANPSTYPEEILTSPLQLSIDRLKAKLREVPSVAAAMDDHESVADRAERLSARYTREDGSAR